MNDEFRREVAAVIPGFDMSKQDDQEAVAMALCALPPGTITKQLKLLYAKHFGAGDTAS